MAAFSGWGGRVIVGASPAIALPVTRWSVNYRADPIDSTTMEHNGTYDAVTGVAEYDISFDCIWDSGVSPLGAAAPNFNPGGFRADNVASTLNSAPTYIFLKLYFDFNVASRSWDFGRVLVTDFAMDDEVRGIVKYSVTAKATKGVTFGGSVSTAAVLTSAAVGLGGLNPPPTN